MIRLLVLLAALIACPPARPALAEAPLTGTLRTVAERGTILVGYREAAVPFSFLDLARKPAGFSVDLCRGIAEDAAKALGRPLLEPDAPEDRTGLRIVYVRVAAEARLPMLVHGDIDLECGSTTANAAREKVVAFSPVFFLAGTRLLAPASSPARSYRDLAGRVVAAGAGTTNADVVRKLAMTTSPRIELAEEPSLDAAYAMLSGGQADALASDDVLLAGLVAAKPDGHRFRIVGEELSVEPYAIGLRRDDTMFADLVRASFERMARSGELRRLYARWLEQPLPNGKTLGLPLSPALDERFRALGAPE